MTRGLALCPGARPIDLHPTFGNSERTVSGDSEDGFPLSTNGWGTFKLAATVHFKDGTTWRLEHELDLWRAGTRLVIRYVGTMLPRSESGRLSPRPRMRHSPKHSQHFTATVGNHGEEDGFECGVNLFEAPFSVRMGNWFQCLLGVFATMLLAPGVIGALLWYTMRVPLGVAIGVGVVLAMLGAYVASMHWRRQFDRVWRTEHGLHFQSPLGRRLVLPVQIGMIRIEETERSLIQGRRSVILLQTLGAGTLRLVLLESDADACFDTMRHCCPHCPAQRFDEETYEPVDPDHRATGVEILRRSLKRQAWAHGAAGIIAVVWVLPWVPRLWQPQTAPTVRVLAGVMLGSSALLAVVFWNFCRDKLRWRDEIGQEDDDH